MIRTMIKGCFLSVAVCVIYYEVSDLFLQAGKCLQTNDLDMDLCVR